MRGVQRIVSLLSGYRECLRIPDSYDAKIAKICKSACNSANQPSFQNPTNKDVTALFTSMERWPKRLFVGF